MRRWLLAVVLSLSACSKTESSADVTSKTEGEAAPGAVAEAVVQPAQAPSPDAPAQPGLLAGVKVDPARMDGVRFKYRPAPSRIYSIDFIQEGEQIGVGGRKIQRGVRQQLLVQRSSEAKEGAEWRETLRFLKVELSPTQFADSAEPPPHAKAKEGDAAKNGEKARPVDPQANMQGVMDRMATSMKNSTFVLDAKESGALKVSAEERKDKAPQPMAEVLGDMLRDASIIFPDRSIKPGDSWDDSSEEKRDRAASHVVAKRGFKWHFVGWLPPTKECPSCIAVKGDGTLDRSGNLDIPGLKGTMAGKSSIRVEGVVNTESGQVEKLVMTAMDIQNHDAVNAGQEVTLTEKMRIRLTLERKDAESAPAAAPTKEEKQ